MSAQAADNCSAHPDWCLRRS